MTIARMADSVEPQEIPELYTHRPNGVAEYYDGHYAWTHRQAARFPRYWRITTTGAADSSPFCRVVDVERFDATPGDVPPYQDLRTARGQRTMVYCDRDNTKAVIDAYGGSDRWQQLEWWLATLDGLAWTPDSITAWIRAQLRVSIDPAKIRAIQTTGMGAYDMSKLFGDPDWNHT